MRRFQDLSIQRKQMLIIMLTSSVALLLACAAFGVHEVVTFRAGMVQSLSTLADVIANNSTAPVQYNVPRDAEETLGLLRSEKHIVAAWIYGRDGKVFAAYPGADAATARAAPKLEAVGHRFSRDALLLWRPIRLNGEVVGTICLRSNLEALYSRLDQYLRIVLFVLLASSFVAFVLSTRLQRLISHPILRLAETAREVAQRKNYSVRAHKQSEDEIGQLIDGFNDMLAQIQERDADLQTAHDELEYRVEHRTAELSHANDRILKEFDERARAEDALRKSDERFQLVARATNDAVWDWDIETDALWWNEGFKTLFSYRDEDIEPGVESWLNRLHPEDSERVLASVQAILNGSETYWSGEYRFRRADGAYAYIFDRGYVIRDARRKAVRMVGAMLDLTERKRAEEEWRKAKEAAEAASTAKSQFLANMSHEIRTPMNGIIGMTELTLETELNAEQRGLLATVRESAGTLLHLINDILDFSKIEAGKLQLEPMPFLLRACLEDAVPALALRAHEKGLELACHFPPDLPDALIGDPNRLRQIVINLMGNAIKFTERGEVVLRVDPQRVSAEEVLLHFSVTDTGIGIPKDKQRLIFEAFTQADNSTTRTYGGTGLGLAISAQLVELMGGEIWVESEPGRGSVFHFTARFLRQQDLSALPALDRATLHQLPVLVVDDNATNRRILQEFVACWGMKPSVAASGPDALEEMQRHAAGGEPFQVVLLDALMPEMDGFAVVARLRANPSLAGAVIMMLSSAGQLEDAARCRALGVSLYLTKPVKQSDLLDAILTALGTAPVTVRPRPALPEAARRAPHPLRLLLAEDNPVNQRLAVRLLEKWGHQVVVAANGRKAVAAWGKEAFDAILMDVQMPEMGGFEATAAIRAGEPGTGRHTPIIAMTAHAMTGDRERCLKAGMDDYVTKPIDQKRLFAVLEKMVPAPASISPLMLPAESADSANVNEFAAPDSAGATPAPDFVFDPSVVLNRVDGDRELLREVVMLFFEDTPKLLTEMRAAIDRGDARALERAAHTLKGSISNFGVPSAVAPALRLEQMARAGELAPALAAWEQLQLQVNQLVPALEALVKEEAA